MASPLSSLLAPVARLGLASRARDAFRGWRAGRAPAAPLAIPSRDPADAPPASPPQRALLGATHPLPLRDPPRRLEAAYDDALRAALDASGITGRAARLPKAPDTSYLHEIPLSAITSFDIPRIREAINEHDLGWFYESALLSDWMLRDDRMRSSIGTRTGAVLGLPFSIRPNPKSQKKRLAGKMAKALETDWPQICPRSTLSEQLRWGSTQGFNISQIVWDTARDRWVPRLENWHPAYSYYRWDLRQYVAIGQEGQRELTPGDGKWAVYAPHDLYRGWYYAAVRCLGIPVALRQYALRDHGRASELYGMGVRCGYLPANADPADRDRFLQQLANLGNESILLLPRGMGAEWEAGFDFEIKALSGEFKGEIFDRLCTRGDMAITLVLLGQNLTSEVQEGSLAAARVHGDVRQDYLEADVTTLVEWLLDQVIYPWAVFNFGQDVERDDLPLPTWEVEPPEDQDQTSKTLGQVADALVKLHGIGADAQVDVPVLLSHYGVPLRDPDDDPAPLPAPAPPPETPPPAQDTP